MIHQPLHTVIGKVAIYHGWGKDVLPTISADSIDSVVCDPPYGLTKEPDMAEVLAHWLAGDDYSRGGGGFMGKKWDSFVPGPATWKEVIRVLKPGGYALVFAGTRTQDLMALSLRLAGFEIRDCFDWWHEGGTGWEQFLSSLSTDQTEAFTRLMDTGDARGTWAYGSGFPKSADVAKGIDKTLGAKRDVVGKTQGHMPHAAKGWGNPGADTFRDERRGVTAMDITVPATDGAKKWEGFGSALKPAHEPIIIARKPLGEKTIVANVLMYGTGALNIDGCRIHAEDVRGGEYAGKRFAPGASVNTDGKWKQDMEFKGRMKAGRWPANLIHDGSEGVLACFHEAPGQQGAVTGQEPSNSTNNVYGQFNGRPATEPRTEVSTSAARFFYCAKAGAEDRSEENDHPTVKPQALMRYLVRLVTPPGGVVLDSFAGSGSTGVAALSEGFSAILVEQDAHNIEIVKRRLLAATEQGALF